MKIAIVAPVLLPVPPIMGGSVETYVDKVARLLAATHEVYVYCISHPKQPELEHSSNITWVRFSPPAKQYYADVTKALLAESFDIVQVENRPIWAAQIKQALAAAGLSTRVALNMHSRTWLLPNQCQGYPSAMLLNWPDFVIGNSKYTCAWLLQQGARAETLASVYPGVEAERFSPWYEPPGLENRHELRKYHSVQNKVVVLFVGRLKQTKGAHRILQAIKQLVPIIPDVHLMMVGSKWYGENETSRYITRLQKMATALEKNVTLTGFIPPEAVPGYYHMADLLVCPSQVSEGFGLVNVEAMATSLPVIASAVGAIPEVVAEGITGLLVHDYENAAAWADAIQTLALDQVWARQMGEKGKDRALTLFTWNNTAKGLEQCYEQMLRRSLWVH